MSGSVLQQFLILLIDLGIGIGIGFLFDCYRVLRRVLRPGWLITQLADFFFWVCCALLSFRVFFTVTGGEVNFYIFLFAPIGIGLYLKLVSPVARGPLLFVCCQLGRMMSLLSKAFCHIIRLCLFAVIIPFKGLWWLASACLQIVCAIFRILWLPEKLLLRWLWRLLREFLRSSSLILRHIFLRK